jgi:hypothetical protein
MTRLFTKSLLTIGLSALLGSRTFTAQNPKLAAASSVSSRIS